MSGIIWLACCDKAQPITAADLHKCELLLSKDVFVDRRRPAKVSNHQIVERVDRHPAARQDQALHVPPLRPAEGHDPLQANDTHCSFFFILFFPECVV